MSVFCLVLLNLGHLNCVFHTWIFFDYVTEKSPSFKLFHHLLCSDADKTFGVERARTEGGDDGSARLCGGSEVPPRPHLHLPGPGVHALRHLPHRQRGGWEGASSQRHHDHDGALRHSLLVRRNGFGRCTFGRSDQRNSRSCARVVWQVIVGPPVRCSGDHHVHPDGHHRDVHSVVS